MRGPEQLNFNKSLSPIGPRYHTGLSDTPNMRQEKPARCPLPHLHASVTTASPMTSACSELRLLLLVCLSIHSGILNNLFHVVIM